MKRIFKANPMGVALVIVFLLLIVIGVMTSKGADKQDTTSQHATSSRATP